MTDDRHARALQARIDQIGAQVVAALLDSLPREQWPLESRIAVLTALMTSAQETARALTACREGHLH